MEQRSWVLQLGLLAGPIPTTIVRPCAIHGPGAATLREWYFVKRVLDGRRVVLLPDRGSSRFHTTSVPNLAELIFLAAEQPADRVLNCGDPDPPTVLEIERAIAAALDYEWSEVLLEKNGYDVPPAADTPWSTVQPFIVDMAEAERAIGYLPVVRYAEAVPDTVSWLVEATKGRDWRHVLPDAVRHMENSFDYSQEDAVLTDLLASRT
jgi:nucleoside-diphosphate-sugar epimerase